MTKHDKVRQEILKNLAGPTLTPTKLSLSYNLGLFFVTISMIILPLIYLSLITATGWTVYKYASDWGQSGESLDGLGSILVYFTPIICGSILCFFMIKPLFARKAADPGLIKLNSQDEPFIFEYVAALCQRVGAPMPREIIVNCEVNASASFRKGLLSIFSKGDLCLTIGLPLVSGMPLRT